MDLPKISDLDVSGKKVLVRLDVDFDSSQSSDYRLRSSEETLDYLKSKGAKIIVIGHRGRPEGKFDASLGLMSLQPLFDKWGAKVEENLRFDPGEMANDLAFTKK